MSCIDFLFPVFFYISNPAKVPGAGPVPLLPKYFLADLRRNIAAPLPGLLGFSGGCGVFPFLWEYGADRPSPL